MAGYAKQTGLLDIGQAKDGCFYFVFLCMWSKKIERQARRQTFFYFGLHYHKHDRSPPPPLPTSQTTPPPPPPLPYVQSCDFESSNADLLTFPAITISPSNRHHTIMGRPYLHTACTAVPAVPTARTLRHLVPWRTALLLAPATRPVRILVVYVKNPCVGEMTRFQESQSLLYTSQKLVSRKWQNVYRYKLLNGTLITIHFTIH